MMRRPCWCSCLILVLGVATLAISTGWAQESQEIARGRVTTADATLVRFQAGRLDASALSFDPAEGGERRTLTVDQVLRVEAERGNHGGTYALGAGVAGLLGAIIGVNLGSTSEVEVSGSTKATIVAVTTGISTLAGYLVGAGQKKYETVYENPMFESLRNQEHGLAPPAPAVEIWGVCLRF